jgi:hypothetical protein
VDIRTIELTRKSRPNATDLGARICPQLSLEIIAALALMRVLSLSNLNMPNAQSIGGSSSQSNIVQRGKSAHISCAANDFFVSTDKTDKYESDYHIATTVEDVSVVLAAYFA